MTNPPTPPYTEATVELVAEQLLRDYDSEYDASALSWRDFADAARRILDAVVKAGLLLPEGAETRIEYGVEVTFPDEEPIAVPAVNRWAAERSARVTGWVAERRLVERTTWSTSWRPAAAAERLAEGDSSKGSDFGGVADQSKDRQ